MATANLVDPRPAALLPESLTELSHPDALYEVEYGRLVEKPVSALAIWIAGELYAELRSQVRSRNLGWVVPEGMFILDAVRKLIRRPDVAFVSAERWPLDKPLPYDSDWVVVPDLAIEILSPSNAADKMVRKRQEYFRYGVREVWIIAPEDRIVEVWSPTGSRVATHTETLETAILPGVRLPLEPLLPVVA